MKLRSSALPIPAEDPFRHDCLERKPIVESLTELVSNITPPLVLCIDSPWGTGKTTFLRLWEARVKANNIHAIYFNAWSSDFAADPLVPFVGEIAELVQLKIPNKASKHLDRAKRMASLIARRALPAAGKIATAGIFDFQEFTEEAMADLAEGAIKDLTDAYTAEKGLLAKFHDEITKLVAQLPAEGAPPRLLLLVDELDRCRPTYALALLERIKHLFDVDNIVFALALDKRQLRASVEAIYGLGIDSEDYLRRFIDLEYRLPEPKPEAYANYLSRKFEFGEWFKGRSHPEFQYDAKNLHETFCELVKLFGLSLRVQEQCFSRIKLAMLATPANYYFHPALMAALVVLRVVCPDGYRRFTSTEGTAADLLDAIRNRPGGPAFLAEHLGTVLECHLLCVDRGGDKSDPELEQLLKLAQDQASKDTRKARATKIAEIRQHMRANDRNPNLHYILSKIEIGFQLT